MSTFEETAIENFREYLRIKSVHPNPDYESCVTFLTKQASQLDLSFKVIRIVQNKPIVVISWVGTEPSLPSILLNSHTDVVPVFEESWKYPPFDAVMEENGDIYARGTQDMKSVGIMYLEAIRKLKSKGIKLKRTIHLSFVPDEETNSEDGMNAFVHSEEFKSLNVAFALDEGVIVPKNVYPVFYGEKIQWQIHVHCPGTPTHGAKMSPDSPGDKLRHIINKFMDYRNKLLEERGEDFLDSSNVTSINLTKISGGVQNNVVPELFTATFDLRIAVHENLEELETTFQTWCQEAGKDVYIEFINKESHVPVSKIDDSNIYWVAFKQATEKMNLTIYPIICPGNTDSRFLRSVGVQAFGFTPISNTPTLLHAHNERINKKDFLNGIQIYYEVLQAIANV